MAAATSTSRDGNTLRDGRASISGDDNTLHDGNTLCDVGASDGQCVGDCMAPIHCEKRCCYQHGHRYECLCAEHDGIDPNFHIDTSALKPSPGNTTYASGASQPAGDRVETGTSQIITVSGMPLDETQAPAECKMGSGVHWGTRNAIVEARADNWVPSMPK